MILAGAWLAIIGYGILYTGIAKLSGVPASQATLRQAFTHAGISPTLRGASDTNPPGVTLAAAQAQAQGQQSATIPGTVLI